MQWRYKVGEKNSQSFPGFSTDMIIVFHKNFGDLAAFRAIFSHISPRMRRNGYSSWHLLGRVATPWDHNYTLYPVNSCFAQIFDCTKIILFLIIFPRGCTELPENSMSFPSIPDFSRFLATLKCILPDKYWWKHPTRAPRVDAYAKRTAMKAVNLAESRWSSCRGGRWLCRSAR